jgi:membrane protease YdiL (CAAX protease family)
MIVQHVLVFFLIVVTPLWDWYEIPRLKASTDPQRKIRFYGKVVAASWICAVVAALAIGLVTVLTIHRVPGDVTWLDPGSRGRLFLEGLMLGMLIVILMPAVMALRSEKIRTKAAKAAKKLAFLLPSTKEERRWWWLVCITAGICEEVVYRGFLLHYFHTLPFHFGLTWALVVSSVIFGGGHLYQGVGRAVPVAALGFVLGAIFLATGNLLLPMIVHAVMDLRVLAMLPEGFETAE